MSSRGAPSARFVGQITGEGVTVTHKRPNCPFKSEHLLPLRHGTPAYACGDEAKGIPKLAVGEDNWNSAGVPPPPPAGAATSDVQRRLAVVNGCLNTMQGWGFDASRDTPTAREVGPAIARLSALRCELEKPAPPRAPVPLTLQQQRAKLDEERRSGTLTEQEYLNPGV
eukprot:gene19559-66890_t